MKNFSSFLFKTSWLLLNLCTAAHEPGKQSVSSVFYCLLTTSLNSTHFAEARFQMSVAVQTFFSRKDKARLVGRLQANNICSNTGKKIDIYSSQRLECA